MLSKRGLDTNFSLVYSCAVDEPIDRFVLPRAPANVDEDNVVYTGRVHISEERLEACYVVSSSAMQLGGALMPVSLARKHIVRIRHADFEIRSICLELIFYFVPASDSFSLE